MLRKSSDDCKTACVIGGGVAGLSAAVFLTKEGFKVKLIEASPRLGGRAYSFFDKTIGTDLDNGQHIFASWYRDTFDFLKIIGSYDKLTFQKKLEIDFLDLNGKSFKLKCPDLKAPFHLLYGLMTYKAIKLSERLGAIKLVRQIKSGAILESKLKAISASELFDLTSQSKALIEAFWKPFIIAVFNAQPENTSAYMFAEIIKMGFIEKGNSELVLPDDFLSNIYAEPAEKYLAEKGSEVLKSAAIKKLNFMNDMVESAELETGEILKSDYFISSVPFFSFKNIAGEDVFNNDYTKVESLKSSPILNVHIKFKDSIESIFRPRFAGVLKGTIQWIFKVTSNQLCIVISSAKELAEKDKDEIIGICKNELFKCLPELKFAEIEGIRVIKEMRATFVPDNKSLDARPENKTKYKNFYIAGDWTNTGLPATIEGAVRSSKNSIEQILKSL